MTRLLIWPTALVGVLAVAACSGDSDADYIDVRDSTRGMLERVETMPATAGAEMPQPTGAAAYNGYTELRVRPARDAPAAVLIEYPQPIYVFGEVGLEVDFRTGRINGQMGNFYNGDGERVRGALDVVAEIDGKTEIAGNARGNFAIDDFDGSVNLNLRDGRFRGNEGQALSAGLVGRGSGVSASQRDLGTVNFDITGNMAAERN